MTITESDPDAALKENQAAKLLGVSPRTLQAWRLRGGGPPYLKIGRAVRYQRKVLVAFLRRPSHCLYLRCRVGRLFWSCRAARPCRRLLRFPFLYALRAQTKARYSGADDRRCQNRWPDEALAKESARRCARSRNRFSSS